MQNARIVLNEEELRVLLLMLQGKEFLMEDDKVIAVQVFNKLYSNYLDIC